MRRTESSKLGRPSERPLVTATVTGEVPVSSSVKMPKEGSRKHGRIMFY